MRSPYLIAILFILLTAACGGSTGLQVSDTIPSGAPPLVLRVAPASGAIGAEVSLFGVGYSVIPAENIVHLGDTAILAETYNPISSGQPGEAEQLTFTVPDDATLGDNSIFISVLGIPSNAELIFTVTP